ncbi:TRAP transporter large permease subunit [Consotaella aegiceratis]|uniref:TRAP transporter large permease n=1 Tax=Consotaella aegiceratis TaxID=3097961 RepID=UPI002F408468
MQQETAGIEPGSPFLQKLETLHGAIAALVRYLLIALLAVMSALISYQVISRYFFNAPSGFTEEFLRYSLIWLGILGAGLCFLKGLHLNLPLVADAVSQRNRERLQVFNALLSLGFGAVLCWGGYWSISDNALTLSPMLHVPLGTLQSVLLIAGTLIIFSQIVELTRLVAATPANARTILVMVARLAVVFALAVAARRTETYDYLIYEHLGLFSVIILFGSFFLFLALGTPISVGLALSGIFTLTLQIDSDVLASTVGGQIFSGLDNFGFLALPFFVLAGNIMNQGGIARRLIDLAMVLGRRIPGSLWQANVLANMLFGCLSGSGIAAATAIGSIIAPIAREKNYDMAFTTAVNAASAPTGMLIPPTGAFIVFSLITGGSASIVALFLAGYVPGIIMGVSVMIVAAVYAKRNGYESDREPYSASELVTIFVRAVPSLFLVVLVIGGIVGGAFTATEGSGIAVLYSLVLAAFYRSLSPRKLILVATQTIASSGVILFLIACSGLMSWSMTFAGIPDTIGEMLTSISENKYIILLLINVALLIVGVFMDMSPAMLIFTPILFPVVTGLGIHPVHFGVMLVYNLCMGIVTPVGTVLFVSCGITGEKITRVIGPLLPMFAIQFIGLLLVTYLPEMSLFLPRLFGVL